MEILTTRK